jgi:membrane protein DedA with SNARE-associated domain
VALIRGPHAAADLVPPLVLASITDTITHWVAAHGAYAIFVVMAIDAVFPAGGELTMVVAGAIAGGALAGDRALLFGHTLSTGVQSYVVLALSGTLGYLAGSLVGWLVGRWGGRPLLERHGRWLHLGPDRLERAERWFDRHGGAAVFLGRLTPVVRSFISIPAGALESPLVPYAVLTLAGSAIWCFAFAAAGWALGSNYHAIDRVFTVIEVLVVAAAVAAILGWLLRRRRPRRT